MHRRRTTDERRARSADHRRGLRRGVLLPRRHGRVAAVPGYPEPPARADQGGQRRARSPATRPRCARGPQARLRVAAGHALRRDGLTADRARRAPRGRAAVTRVLALEITLALVVLGIAVWTIAARETFAAVVGFVAYGLMLALVWVRLDAVDVALTEAAIGSGLNGILLLGAAARLRATEVARPLPHPGPGVRVAAAVLSLSVAAALAVAVLSLPDPAPTLAPEAAASLPATGLGNPVTAVLMVYRAMDTMLEKVVRRLALVGEWSLATDRSWGGRPGPRHLADPAGALAFLARLLPPMGVVVGVYVVWAGADAPGGAFAGGTILAAMWLVVMMAGLADTPPVSGRWLRLTLIAGPAVFLVVGLGGLWLGEAFLAYPVAWAKPLILAVEVPMTLTIAVTLALLLAGAPERAER